MPDFDQSSVERDAQNDPTLYVDAGNPHGVDLTNFAETIVHLVKAFGVHPTTMVDTLLLFLAEDEGGRGGVDSYTLRDADGILIDYVVVPSED